MAGHTITKKSHAGSGFSVVDLNDVRHVFASATPKKEGDLHQQAEDALRTIETVVREQGTGGSIVHQAVFMADNRQINECRRIMLDFYGKELPATSYIYQPPSSGKLLAIEALGVGQGKGEVDIERVSEQLVIARHNGIAWAHCAQVVPQNNADGVYDGSLNAFKQIQTLFVDAKIRFDQVIRTWLYLGGIVEDDGPVQRYKELNRARTDFYHGISFQADQLHKNCRGPIFPASTGIGTEGRGIMISAIALATDRKDILVVPLENPRQTPAFDYAVHYSPKSPKFSRAMALSCGNYATIFISGTASITHSETKHAGDAAAQTHETLDNIEALISENNLARHHLPGLGTSLDGLALVRVYVKNQADYAAIRAVCEKRLGELPAIFAKADVCRPDLLVEIEGIAFSRKADAP